jgi:Na+-driven multidrug efflux pump
VFLYLALYALVLPFSFMESIYNGLKNANGQPEAPFIRMVLMLILKILFNFIFIYIFRLGIVGCALSSLLANLGISAWMYQELFLKKGPDRLDLRGFRFNKSILEKLWRIGVPAMLNSFMLNLGFFLINNETQAYGPIVLNGQGIANNISAVCFNLPGSFSAAVTTMVSMNIGASQPDKARRSMQIGCIISEITALATIDILVPL